MKTIKYHKLVRDNIPDIIAEAGKECAVDILSDSEYVRLLEEKLDEEIREYHETKDPEELADILEVVYALAKAKGIGPDELENIRKEKAYRNGGFEKKLLLTEVTEPEYEE